MAHYLIHTCSCDPRASPPPSTVSHAAVRAAVSKQAVVKHSQTLVKTSA